MKTKALLASVGVHGTVLAALLYFSVHEPRPLPMEKRAIILSLASYTPSKNSSKPVAKKVSVPKKIEAEPVAPRPERQKQVTPFTRKAPEPKERTRPAPLPTPQAIPSSSPAVLPEASSPQFSAVRPSVAPSALEPTIENSSQEDKKPIANNSPFIAPSASATHVSKKDLSRNEIDGATLGRIRTMIENSLTYPAIARKLRIEGTVVVSFILKSSGLVEKVEIVTTSGSAMLDSKALQTVLALNGEYPTLAKAAFLKVPIAFSITGH